MSDARSIVRKLRRSRRRGKYAVESLGKAILSFPDWEASMSAVSGAGEMSDLNFPPDLLAINNRLGIIIAFEVKSSKSRVVYLTNRIRRRKDGTLPPIPKELLQVKKLFASLNFYAWYPRRWAVLACKFHKSWRFMILHTYHLKFSYIKIYRRQTKNVFHRLSDLLKYVEAHDEICFPKNMEKTRAPLPVEKATLTS
jgi:hypothetical protein